MSDYPLIGFKTVFKPDVYDSDIKHLVDGMSKEDASYEIGKQLPLNVIDLVYKYDYPIVLACWIATKYSKILTKQLYPYMVENYEHWGDLRIRQATNKHLLFTWKEFFKLDIDKAIYHERDLYYNIKEKLDAKDTSKDKSIKYYQTEKRIE